MRSGWWFIFMFYLVFIGITVIAQEHQPKAITVQNAAACVGKTVKINVASYQTQDDGQTLLINTKQGLTLVLNGGSRKKIKKDLQSRRELNTQIKSPLDTSITATGKIILRHGLLIMQVSRASDIYLGADLQIEIP